MRIRAALIALVLLAGAPPLLAQRPGPAAAPRAPGPGPFELLLAHRAELALSDTQVQRILEIRAHVEQRNAPLIARLVRMRRELGPQMAPHAMSHGDRAELRERTRAAHPLVARIRANNHAAMLAVGRLLTDGQKEGVRRLVEQRRQRGHAPHSGPPGARGPGG
jgi:hypothetical protein